MEKSFDFAEFDRICHILESEEVFAFLRKLEDFSEVELLREMEGINADTRELFNSPESSKYPISIAQIKLIQELKKVARRIMMTRKLRSLIDEQER